jgi:hypothetical protein
MFILPSCSPSAAISRRVLRRSSWSRCDAENDEDADADDSAPRNLGLDGTEESGLSDGVALPAGVPLRDCSWLAMGVISVPTSRIDTAGAARSLFGGGGRVAGPRTDDGDEDLVDSSVTARELGLSLEQDAALPFDAAADSGATLPPSAGACGAVCFLANIGFECTTCRPAIHFSASFHLDGTCRKNGAAATGDGPRASLWNSKLPPPPLSCPLSLPAQLCAALPWLASERDREESDGSFGYSADRNSNQISRE